jgi:hypothetical protein
MKVLTLDPLDDLGRVGVDLHRPRLLGPAQAPAPVSPSNPWVSRYWMHA